MKGMANEENSKGYGKADTYISYIWSNHFPLARVEPPRKRLLLTAPGMRTRCHWGGRGCDFTRWQRSSLAALLMELCCSAWVSYLS